jgi:hypothetical protein
MKDLAECLFTQSMGLTDNAGSISRMGLTSFKSDADHSSHILMNEVSPKISQVVQLPETIMEQQSIMNSARKKISS